MDADGSGSAKCQEHSLNKREEQLSVTLDPARACLHAVKIIVVQWMGVYNRNGRRPKSEIRDG